MKKTRRQRREMIRLFASLYRAVFANYIEVPLDPVKYARWQSACAWKAAKNVVRGRAAMDGIRMSDRPKGKALIEALCEVQPMANSRLHTVLWERSPFRASEAFKVIAEPKRMHEYEYQFEHVHTSTLEEATRTMIPTPEQERAIVDHIVGEKDKWLTPPPNGATP